MPSGNGCARLGRMLDWFSVVRCGESAGGKGGERGAGGAGGAGGRGGGGPMLPHQPRPLAPPPSYPERSACL